MGVVTTTATTTTTMTTAALTSKVQESVKAAKQAYSSPKRPNSKDSSILLLLSSKKRNTSLDSEVSNISKNYTQKNESIKGQTRISMNRLIDIDDNPYETNSRYSPLMNPQFSHRGSSSFKARISHSNPAQRSFTPQCQPQCYVFEEKRIQQNAQLQQFRQSRGSILEVQESSHELDSFASQYLTQRPPSEQKVALNRLFLEEKPKKKSSSKRYGDALSYYTHMSKKKKGGHNKQGNASQSQQQSRMSMKLHGPFLNSANQKNLLNFDRDLYTSLNHSTFLEEQHHRISQEESYGKSVLSYRSSRSPFESYSNASAALGYTRNLKSSGGIGISRENNISASKKELHQRKKSQLSSLASSFDTREERFRSTETFLTVHIETDEQKESDEATKPVGVVAFVEATPQLRVIHEIHPQRRAQSNQRRADSKLLLDPDVNDRLLFSPTKVKHDSSNSILNKTLKNQNLNNTIKGVMPSPVIVKRDHSANHNPQKQQQQQQLMPQNYVRHTRKVIHNQIARIKSNENIQIIPGTAGPSGAQSSNAGYNPIEQGSLKNQVSIDSFEILEELGKGSYASVKLAQEKKSNTKVAIKIYEKFKLIDPNKFKIIRKEINILSKMNHPNIIRLYHVIDTVSNLNLVMEYIGKNSMFNFLQNKKKNQLSMNSIRKIFIQIMQGINYMHTKNVCHRDIKLENILIDEDMNLKIIDFGFAVCSPPERRLDNFCGTPSYMAPEIILKKEYLGQPTDIWSAGIVLYILICGRFPFKGIDEKDLFRKISKHSYEIPKSISQGARSLISRCLAFNPDDRPSSSKVLRDTWLQSTEEEFETNNQIIAQQNTCQIAAPSPAVQFEQIEENHIKMDALQQESKPTKVETELNNIEEVN